MLRSQAIDLQLVRVEAFIRNTRNDADKMWLQRGATIAWQQLPNMRQFCGSPEDCLKNTRRTLAPILT